MANSHPPFSPCSAARLGRDCLFLKASARRTAERPRYEADDSACVAHSVGKLAATLWRWRPMSAWEREYGELPSPMFSRKVGQGLFVFTRTQCPALTADPSDHLP